jgi:hypothetical protein
VLGAWSVHILFACHYLPLPDTPKSRWLAVPTLRELALFNPDDATRITHHESQSCVMRVNGCVMRAAKSKIWAGVLLDG